MIHLTPAGFCSGFNFGEVEVSWLRAECGIGSLQQGAAFPTFGTAWLWYKDITGGGKCEVISVKGCLEVEIFLLFGFQT